MIIGSHLESLLHGQRASLPGTEGFPAHADTARKYEPSRTVVQKHLELSLTIDPATKSIAGEALLVLEGVARQSTSVVLDAKELSVEAVEWALLAVDAKPSGPLSPSSFVSVQTTPAPFTFGENRLEVFFPSSVARGDKVLVRVRYSATKPNAGVYFVKAKSGDPYGYDCVWTQGQDVDSPFWFPCQDDPRLKLSARLHLCFPKDWECVSNGTLESDIVRENVRAQSWCLPQPQAPYLLAFAMGELRKVATTWRGKEVACYLPVPFEFQAQACLQELVEMLEFYSSYWGFEYPYAKYAQAFVSEFVFGGMENTTCTINTDECLGPKEYAVGSDLRPILVFHEMAHQWFGDTLTCETWSEGWLNEGFATHSEVLWDEHAHGKDSGPFYMHSEIRPGYLSESASYMRPLVTNHYEFVSEIFDAHLYQKGAMVLHHLRDVLGEEDFRSSVKRYLEKNAFAPVVTRDLMCAVEEATGWNPRPFFDTWVHRAGHVELEADYKVVDAGTPNDPQAKVLEISVNQKQKISKESPAFDVETFVQVHYKKSGGMEETRVRIGKAEERLRVPLKAGLEVSHAVLDPRSTLVGSVEHTLPESFCVEILSSAESSAWFKFLAMQNVLKKYSSEANLGLVAAWLAKEPVFRARMAAYEKLGESSSPAAGGLLFQTLKETHPIARQAWARALGTAAVVPELRLETLSALATSEDENTHVRMAALDGLLEAVKSTPALRLGAARQRLVALGRRMMETPSFCGHLAAKGTLLVAEFEAEAYWQEFAATLVAKETRRPAEVIAAASALANLSARNPSLRHETRPHLLELANASHPVRLLWRLPGLLSASGDVALDEAFERFLGRKNYGPLSMLIPRARRARLGLSKKAQGADVAEKLVELADLKKKAEKTEQDLQDLKTKVEALAKERTESTKGSASAGSPLSS